MVYYIAVVPYLILRKYLYIFATNVTNFSKDLLIVTHVN